MPRTSPRTSKSSSRRSASGGKLSPRTKVVWGALAGSMTIVAGLLLLVDGQGAVWADGRSLQPMVGIGASTSIESIFRTTAELDRGRWQAIVIHHSGARGETPASLEARHLAANLNGLGYHFLVGDGSRMREGEIHVGYRWLRQEPGAHVAGPDAQAWNQASIGICLMGDGDRQAFGHEQMRRLAQLVVTLARELDIPPDRVVLHRDLVGVSSPGRLFPEAEFRREVARLLANG